MRGDAKLVSSEVGHVAVPEAQLPGRTRRGFEDELQDLVEDMADDSAIQLQGELEAYAAGTAPSSRLVSDRAARYSKTAATARNAAPPKLKSNIATTKPPKLTKKQKRVLRVERALARGDGSGISKKKLKKARKAAAATAGALTDHLNFHPAPVIKPSAAEKRVDEDPVDLLRDLLLTHAPEAAVGSDWETLVSLAEEKREEWLPVLNTVQLRLGGDKTVLHARLAKAMTTLTSSFPEEMCSDQDLNREQLQAAIRKIKAKMRKIQEVTTLVCIREGVRRAGEKKKVRDRAMVVQAAQEADVVMLDD